MNLRRLRTPSPKQKRGSREQKHLAQRISARDGSRRSRILECFALPRNQTTLQHLRKTYGALRGRHNLFRGWPTDLSRMRFGVPMTQPKDGYDAAVEYFTQKPEEMVDSWAAPLDHEFGFIFRFLSERGNSPEGERCGCPSMIASDGTYHASGPSGPEIDELCKSIVKPSHNPIGVEELPAFARVQRFADEKIPGRTVPKLVGGKWKLVKP